MNLTLTQTLRSLYIWMFIAMLFSCDGPTASIEPTWPTVTNETKPWTRWWWHGSAVTKEGITAELEKLDAVGIGGVELTPIFGVIGKEDQFIDYLSEEWMDMLLHTLSEAERLGLGVDMATGTGWPFGGPWVGAEDAPKNFTYQTYKVAGGSTLTESVTYTQEPLVRSVTNMVYQLYGIYRVPGEEITGSMKEPELLQRRPRLDISQIKEPISVNEDLQGLALDQVRFEKQLPLVTLMAYSDAGDVLDLTDRVDYDGQLDWLAPAGSWELVALFQGWHGKMVERAAPGGEGNTLDHFSEEAIRNYLARFDSAFEGKDISYLRAFFNDSYEVDDARGEADWTPGFLDSFQSKRGYDLREYLRELISEDDEEINRRIRMDYRETIGELLLENFTSYWDEWADGHGAQIRSQAHGSPGNLLDLYGASDIPETEGTDPIAVQFASSAAHVAGKKLASSESATWLDEHFLSSLQDVRGNVERYLLGGINHVFYHGTAYSPGDEPWPGYLFYAAIHANDRNTWWQDFAQLNQYITRVQSFLQEGQPANELLMYLPIYDLYATKGRERLMHFDLGRGEFTESATHETAQWLRAQGYAFDFVSDQQLLAVEGAASVITTIGGEYKGLLIPPCEFMPVSTLEKILALAKEGVPIIFQDGLPASPPGLGDLADRQRLFDELLDELPGFPSVRISEEPGVDLPDVTGMVPEAMVESGIEWIKRKHDTGYYYLIVNHGEQAIDGYVPLSCAARSVAVFDPMTGISGVGRVQLDDGKAAVYLQLPVGESLLLMTSTNDMRGPSFPYYQETGEVLPLAGPWEVSFVRGGPELPPPVVVEDLVSWTEMEAEGLTSFSGTASYKITFDRPEGTAWKLDLGEVRESARVLLNGREVSALIGPDFSLVLRGSDLEETNELEIQVSNLMANRIADMDQRGVFWKRFYNVNFPARLAENRTAGLFDASAWEPRDSGLLGPVTLTRLEQKVY